MCGSKGVNVNTLHTGPFPLWCVFLPSDYVSCYLGVRVEGNHSDMLVVLAVISLLSSCLLFRFRGQGSQENDTSSDQSHGGEERSPSSHRLRFRFADRIDRDQRPALFMQNHHYMVAETLDRPVPTRLAPTRPYGSVNTFETDMSLLQSFTEMVGLIPTTTFAQVQ